MKNRRHKSREMALRALYQWLLTQEQTAIILRDLRDTEGYASADPALVEVLVAGTIREAGALNDMLAPCLSRTLAELSPVEHAVLLIAAYEFVHHPEVPYRVVINEAIELAKGYGGTDGHRFVNGVLDRLAAVARAPEVEASRS